MPVVEGRISNDDVFLQLSEDTHLIINKMRLQGRLLFCPLLGNPVPSKLIKLQYLKELVHKKAG
jgi:hypothetical protein